MINIVVLSQNRKQGLVALFSDLFWQSLNPALLFNHYPRLVVLDQGSTDDTRDYVDKLQPQEDVHYMPILSDYNYGCGGGRQRAVDRLIGAMLQPDDFIVFLDDDIQVTAVTWLHAMLKPFYDPTIKADIVGCEGMEIAPNGYTYPALWTPGYAEYVSGGWSVFKASLFLDGLAFDPQFNPNYFEDADICFAARVRGKRVYSVGPVGLAHKSLSDEATRKQLYQTNKAKFQDKWKDRSPEHAIGVYYAEY